MTEAQGKREVPGTAGAATKEVILEIGPVAHGGHFVARLAGDAGSTGYADSAGDTDSMGNAGSAGDRSGAVSDDAAVAGSGLAKASRRVVFVRHAVPGERVRAILTEAEADAAFWRADVVEVLAESVEFAGARVAHFWPEADSGRAHSAGTLPIGGAEFGHLRLPAQRALKAMVLAEQLQRLAGLEVTTEVQEVPGEDPTGLGWRTRTGFAVTPEGRLGMHAHRSHEVIAVQDMPLADRRIRDLALWDLDFSGLDRVEVAAPTSGDGPLVLLSGTKQAAARLARELPGGVSAAHWDAKSSRVSALRGRPWLRESVPATPGSGSAPEFRVSGDGFWQIHRKAPEVLSDTVRAYLGRLPQCRIGCCGPLCRSGIVHVAARRCRRPHREGAFHRGLAGDQQRRDAQFRRPRRGAGPARPGGSGACGGGSGKRGAARCRQARCRSSGPAACRGGQKCGETDLRQRGASGGLRFLRSGIIRPRRGVLCC
jgi:hypothetical protein